MALCPELNRLAKRLNIRQQAIATAQVYLKRFFTRVEVRRTNPYVLCATALYLACKMEECPQHIRLVAVEARALWSADVQNLDTAKLGECEFLLISEMRSNLIVHQPYRTLAQLQQEGFPLAASTSASASAASAAPAPADGGELALAWSVVNDSYMTDLPLMYPPHLVALTAMLLAYVLRPLSGGGGGGQGGTGTAAGAGMANNIASGLASAAATLASAQGRGGGSGTTTPTTPGAVAPWGSLPSGGATTPGTAGGGGLVEGTAEKKAPNVHLAKIQRFANWLADSNVDVEAMVDVAQELIAFYECQESYNDKVVKEQISRYIKARGLEK